MFVLFVRMEIIIIIGWLRVDRGNRQIPPSLLCYVVQIYESFRVVSDISRCPWRHQWKYTADNARRCLPARKPINNSDNDSSHNGKLWRRQWVHIELPGHFLVVLGVSSIVREGAFRFSAWAYTFRFNTSIPFRYLCRRWSGQVSILLGPVLILS